MGRFTSWDFLFIGVGVFLSIMFFFSEVSLVFSCFISIGGVDTVVGGCRVAVEIGCMWQICTVLVEVSFDASPYSVIILVFVSSESSIFSFSSFLCFRTAFYGFCFAFRGCVVVFPLTSIVLKRFDLRCCYLR